MQVLDLKNARLTWRGDELMAATRRLLARRLRTAGEKIKVRCQRLISTSSQSGSSQPGEPPHLRTGALRNSIISQVDESALSVQVGTTLAYGYHLEFGTMTDRVIHAEPGKVFSWIDPDTGKRIFARSFHLKPLAARPFLRPALYDAVPEVRQALLLNFDGTLAGEIVFG